MRRRWWVIPVFLVCVLLLAAALFPWYTSRGEPAPLTRCIHNLKQCAAAIEMYQDDWNGRFPPPLPSPGYPSYDPYAWISPLKPYFAELYRGSRRTADCLHCPKDKNTSSPSSYVMPQSVYGRTFSDSKQAAATAVLFEPWHEVSHNYGLTITLFGDGHLTTFNAE